MSVLQVFLSEDTEYQKLSVLAVCSVTTSPDGAAGKHHPLGDCSNQFNILKNVLMLLLSVFSDDYGLCSPDCTEVVGKCCVRPILSVYDGTGVSVTLGRCCMWKFGLLEKMLLTRNQQRDKNQKAPTTAEREPRIKITKLPVAEKNKLKRI